MQATVASSSSQFSFVNPAERPSALPTPTAARPCLAERNERLKGWSKSWRIEKGGRPVIRATCFAQFLPTKSIAPSRYCLMPKCAISACHEAKEPHPSASPLCSSRPGRGSAEVFPEAVPIVNARPSGSKKESFWRADTTPAP